MRIVLADLKGGDGFISKDTVAGGYGSRLRPFSKVTGSSPGSSAGFTTSPACIWRTRRRSRRARATPSSAREARSSTATSRSCCRRSSITAGKPRGPGRCAPWRARRLHRARRRQAAPPVRGDADFIVDGEPEAAVLELVHGDTLSGIVDSPAVRDLDALPFPRWDRCSCRGVASGAVRRAAGRRIAAGAGEPQLPGVLHLLSAPHPGGLSRALGRQHPRRALVSRRHDGARARHVPRSAVHAEPRSGARAVRRHLEPRAAAHLRVRDAARSARRAAC